MSPDKASTVTASAVAGNREGWVRQKDDYWSPPGTPAPVTDRLLKTVDVEPPPSPHVSGHSAATVPV